MPRSTQDFIPNSAKRRNFVFGGWTKARSVEDGRWVAGRRRRSGKGSGAAVGERSEREKRQFFKIKAVKPNLQVCRRKRAEVVKILVALYLFARSRLTSHLSVPLFLSFSLSLFFSLYSPLFPFLLLHAPFLRLSSDVARAAPLASLVGG